MNTKQFSIESILKSAEGLYKDIRSRNLSKRRTFMLVSSLALISVLAVGGVYYSVRIYTRGQTCYTVAQVQSSSKCLYIYNNQVYEKGTRAAPHHDNPCGSDVTAIIPNNHLIDKVGRLDPNYQGNICANQPAATNTPAPQPTNTPQPQATNTPVPQATATTAPQATNQPTATPTTPASSGNESSPTPTTASSNVSTVTPIRTGTGTLSPTVTQLPRSGATETAFAVISGTLFLIGAAGLIF